MTLIEQIKAALPIAPFVAKHTNGLKPTKLGWFVGRCPFHQPETDPPRKRELWVNSDKGICGCFDPTCPAHWPLRFLAKSVSLFRFVNRTNELLPVQKSE